MADEIAPLLEDQKPYPWPHRNDSISVHAALALYRLGDERGVKSLKGAILKGAEKGKVHVAKAAAKALGSVEKKTAVPILISGLDVQRTQATAEIVRALFTLTGEDPGGDIEVVGWRRAALDARSWLQWWQKNRTDYEPEVK